MIKSDFAPLLNRLAEMQDAPYYAIARPTLSSAEATIIGLEQQLAAAQAEVARLNLYIDSMATIDANRPAPGVKA